MVYFLANNILPNYTLDNTLYKYNKSSNSAYGRGVALELLEINHAYWILHNNNVSEINITTSCDMLEPSDTLIFYNCSNNIAWEKIQSSPNNNFKKIQIVTDQPIIDGCDAYICYDPSIVDRDLDREWFHVLYPLPIGLNKCEPSWPPVNIACIAPDLITVDKTILKNEQFTFIDDSYANRGDEHVLFHIRKSITFNESKGLVSRMKFPSHKTANRLYQSWFCNIPAILSPNPAMQYIKQSDLDFLEAHTNDELLYQVDCLVNDKDLYFAMVDNCKKRENEHNHNIIVSQWKQVLDFAR